MDEGRKQLERGLQTMSRIQYYALRGKFNLDNGRVVAGSDLRLCSQESGRTEQGPGAGGKGLQDIGQHEEGNSHSRASKARLNCSTLLPAAF
eukprot:335339-Hanusia_phi.AAC.1